MIVVHGAPSRLLSRSRYELARRTGAINREGEHAKRLGAQEADADDSVRTALRLDTTRAFCRQRLRYDAKNRVIEYSASWFSLDVADQAPRLSDLPPIDEGTLNHVVEVTGRQIGAMHEEFYARRADELDAHRGIAQVGGPVLVVEFVAYDEDERPLIYEVAVYPERQRITSGLESV
jgi:DNA-binding GntR family transcriptional regulator